MITCITGGCLRRPGWGLFLKLPKQSGGQFTERMLHYLRLRAGFETCIAVRVRIICLPWWAGNGGRGHAAKIGRRRAVHALTLCALRSRVFLEIFDSKTSSTAAMLQNLVCRLQALSPDISHTQPLLLHIPTHHAPDHLGRKASTGQEAHLL